MNQGLNKVILIGQVDGAPEWRYTANGRLVIAFTLLMQQSWMTAGGEQYKEQERIGVVAWGELAEVCRAQLSDGQTLYLEGRLQTRHWQDGEGVTCYRTEVMAQDMLMMPPFPAYPTA